METIPFKSARVTGFILSVVLTITAFIVYSIRDALVIVFILNSLLALSATICSLIPVAGQIGYWFLAKKLLLPVFFSQWFPEIRHTAYIDVVFILCLVSSLSMSLLIMVMARTGHESSSEGY